MPGWRVRVVLVSLLACAARVVTAQVPDGNAVLRAAGLFTTRTLRPYASPAGRPGKVSGAITEAIISTARGDSRRLPFNWPPLSSICANWK